MNACWTVRTSAIRLRVREIMTKLVNGWRQREDISRRQPATSKGAIQIRLRQQITLDYSYISTTPWGLMSD